MLENWMSHTFLSVPSSRYKLLRSASYSEVPVILVTLTLILFLFSYFEQTNHESGISAVWDVTLCRVCDSRRFKERDSIIFKDPSVSRRELPHPCLWQHYVPSKLLEPHKYDALPCHRRTEFSAVLPWETQVWQVRSIRHFSLSTLNSDCRYCLSTPWHLRSYSD
jgi:hypothetical protein